MPCKRRGYRKATLVRSRKGTKLDDITKVTLDASKMLILTSTGLAVSSQVVKALKKGG